MQTSKYYLLIRPTFLSFVSQMMLVFLDALEFEVNSFVS